MVRTYIFTFSTHHIWSYLLPGIFVMVPRKIDDAIGIHSWWTKIGVTGMNQLVRIYLVRDAITLY